MNIDKNTSIKENKNPLVSSDKEKGFFYERAVGKGVYEPIQIRFQTLVNACCEKPFSWYKELDLDKSYASKIRRGIIIPPRWLRIRIAHHFKTDSATIWTTRDLPHIKKDYQKRKVCR